MTTERPDPARVLERGAARGLPVEPFGPIWDSARLRLSRTFWQGADLTPFLDADVPYTGTSNGRLSEDAAEVVLAARPGARTLRVLELGAGSGVFAKLFLDHVARRDPALYAATTYVVTDASPGVAAARDASGILDAHAGRIEARLLDAAGDWDGLGQFDAILGTYVFDSLPFDFLALNDARTWRREVRCVLPETRAEEAEALRRALETDAGLDGFLDLGPRLGMQTRHVEMDRAELPFAGTLPDDTGGETVPFVHCWGAVACLARCHAHLNPGGVLILSDYGHLAPYESHDLLEPQGYGHSIAVGLNFPQIDAAAARLEDSAWHVPGPDAGNVITRVLHRAPETDLGPLVEDLHGPLRYAALTAPVDAGRRFVRGRMLEMSRDMYAKALALQPRNWALLEEIASILLSALEEHEAVIEMVDAGLDLNPLAPGLWRARAEALTALGRLDEARADILKALALAPRSFMSDRTLAEIELAAGDHGAALLAVARALSHDSEAEERDGLMALQGRILAAMGTKQLDLLRAQANAMRALDGMPGPD